MGYITVSINSNQASTFELKEGDTSVGSNKACDIYIDSVSLSPIHLIFSLTEDGLLKATSYDNDSPITINNHKIDTEMVISDTDIVSAGSYEFMYHANATSSPDKPDKDLDIEQKSKKQGYLQILNGQHVGKIVPLAKSLIRMGNEKSQYAMIAHRKDGYFLSHIEGKRPPKVDGEYIVIDSSYPLSDGDIIEIGERKIRFHTQMVV